MGGGIGERKTNSQQQLRCFGKQIRPSMLDFLFLSLSFFFSFLMSFLFLKEGSEGAAGSLLFYSFQ